MAEKVILAEQTIAFVDADDGSGLYVAHFDSPLFSLVAGETYKVSWDGVEYNCSCQTINLDGVNYEIIGNVALIGGEDTGEPFAIASVTNADGDILGNVIATTGTEVSHTVTVNQLTEEDPNVILQETTYEGFTDAELMVSPAPFVLTEGETYRVVWDGVEHECVCGIVDGMPIVTDADNLENPTSVTFAICYLSAEASEADSDAVLLIAYDTSTSHAVAVYLASEDSGDDSETPEETQEGIVLKDRNGNDVAYYGIETVTFDTTTEGKQQTFTKGVAVEGLEIVPDFSGGDMPVNAPAGMLVKSAVVKQPEGLTPGNIRNGAEVAGVTGDFIGDTEEVTVELNMAYGDQEIAPSAPGKVLSHVVVKRPDMLVPENIAENVDIGGVIGSFKGGAPGIVLTNYGGSMAKMFYMVSNFNSGVVVPDDVTNMYQTFYYCPNFNKPVTIGNNVVDMYQTFGSCSNFNQPIAIPSSATSMYGTFSGCKSFNQPIAIPNSVTNIGSLFSSCSNFNQPIAIPNSVRHMDYAFTYCSNFNHPVNAPRGLATFGYVFSNCFNLNSPISIGTGPTDMHQTFANCYNFNQPITIPDGVVNMTYTFSECRNLNQPITIPTSVNNLRSTFINCYNLRELTVKSRNVTNVFYLFGPNVRDVRHNIHVPAGSTTNTYFGLANASSILGNTISWTMDAANNCKYNSYYNFYIYWDL